jgi:hypothetical protein
MDLCFKLFKGSDVPSIDENDATLLQRVILLEDTFPWTLVISLEGDEYVP